MNVQRVMTTPVSTCAPTASLADAARLMSAGRFGFLPIVEATGKLVGALTDRDICVAIGRHNRDPQRAKVAEVMNFAVHTCSVEDDLPAVLATMKGERVRRLPVVDRLGQLKGVVSIDDLVLEAADAGSALSSEAIVDAYRAICEHRLALAASAAQKSHA